MPGVAQRVGRGLALLFHDRGTRMGWVVSSTPQPHFTLWKDPVPILQEAGWAPGPVWMGGKSRPYRYSTPDSLACSQSLYRPSYWAHTTSIYLYEIQYWNITELRRQFVNFWLRIVNKWRLTWNFSCNYAVCNVLIFLIVSNFRIQYLQNITTSNYQ